MTDRPTVELTPLQRNRDALLDATTRLVNARLHKNAEWEATERAEIDRLLEERHGLTGGAS